MDLKGPARPRASASGTGLVLISRVGGTCRRSDALTAFAAFAFVDLAAAVLRFDGEPRLQQWPTETLQMAQPPHHQTVVALRVVTCGGGAGIPLPTAEHAPCATEEPRARATHWARCGCLLSLPDAAPAASSPLPASPSLSEAEGYPVPPASCWAQRCPRRHPRPPLLLLLPAPPSPSVLQFLFPRSGELSPGSLSAGSPSDPASDSSSAGALPCASCVQRRGGLVEAHSATNC